jgi:hypothetical protein
VLQDQPDYEYYSTLSRRTNTEGKTERKPERVQQRSHHHSSSRAATSRQQTNEYEYYSDEPAPGSPSRHFLKNSQSAHSKNHEYEYYSEDEEPMTKHTAHEYEYYSDELHTSPQKTSTFEHPHVDNEILEEKVFKNVSPNDGKSERESYSSHTSGRKRSNKNIVKNPSPNTVDIFSDPAINPKKSHDIDFSIQNKQQFPPTTEEEDLSSFTKFS